VAFGAERLLARDQGRISASLGRAPDAPASPWDATDGFQLSGARVLTVPILVDGAPGAAEVRFGPSGVVVSVDGHPAAADATAIETADAVYVLRGGRQTIVGRADGALRDHEHSGGDGAIRAPMHGKVLSVLVKPGSDVVKGQRLAIIEAMKMEHALVAPHQGRVGEIAVAAGVQVLEGALIMTVVAGEDKALG
jgi:3-methylcrotonyl-CoA carboxylase alpha subunit